MTATMGRKLSYSSYFRNSTVIATAKGSNIKKTVFPTRGPNIGPATMHTKIQSVYTVFHRHRNQSLTAFTFRRAQFRSPPNHLDCFNNGNCTAIRCNIIRSQTKKLLTAHSRSNHEQNAVSHDIIGKMLFKQLKLCFRKRILLTFIILNQIIGTNFDHLGFTGRIIRCHLICFRTIKNLNKHRTAFGDIRSGHSLSRQSVNKTVDIQCLNITDRLGSEVILQNL